MKSRLFIAAAFAGAGFAFWRAQPETTESHSPALKFFAGRCVHGREKRPQAAVDETQWLKDGTLLIKGRAPATCGLKMKYGDYRVEGGKALVLEYGVFSPSGIVAKCGECLHDVSYAITGLAKRDYDISFVSKDVTERAAASGRIKG